MYSDKKRGFWPAVDLAAAALLAAIGIWVWISRDSARNINEESMQALKAAVQNSALQCYVVEGVYPPSLAYLEENYGLQINREDFYVTYDIFASNLPPDIRVTARNDTR